MKTWLHGELVHSVTTHQRPSRIPGLSQKSCDVQHQVWIDGEFKFTIVPPSDRGLLNIDCDVYDAAERKIAIIRNRGRQRGKGFDFHERWSIHSPDPGKNADFRKRSILGISGDLIEFPGGRLEESRVEFRKSRLGSIWIESESFAIEVFSGIDRQAVFSVVLPPLAFVVGCYAFIWWLRLALEDNT